MKIFLGSPFKGLEAVRRTLHDALLGDHEVIWMEDFGSQEVDALRRASGRSMMQTSTYFYSARNMEQRSLIPNIHTRISNMSTRNKPERRFSPTSRNSTKKQSEIRSLRISWRRSRAATYWNTRSSKALKI